MNKDRFITLLLAIGTFLGVFAHWLFISSLVDRLLRLPSGSLRSGFYVGTINCIIGLGSLIFAFSAARSAYALQIALRSILSAVCVGALLVFHTLVWGEHSWIALPLACICYGLCQTSLYPRRLLVAGQIRRRDPHSAAFNIIRFMAVLGLVGGYFCNVLFKTIAHFAPLVETMVSLLLSTICYLLIHSLLRAEAEPVRVNQHAWTILQAWRKRVPQAAILLARSIVTSGLAFGALQIVGVEILTHHIPETEATWAQLIQKSGMMVYAVGVICGSVIGQGRSWTPSQNWILLIGVWLPIAAAGAAMTVAQMAVGLLICGFLLGRLGALVPTRLVEETSASEQHSVIALFANAMTGAPMVGAFLSGLLAEQFGARGAIMAIGLVGVMLNMMLGVFGTSKRLQST